MCKSRWILRRLSMHKERNCWYCSALSAWRCSSWIGAGVWLWHYMVQYKLTLPGFDQLLGALRSADEKALIDIALRTREGWAACEESRGGTLETVVHIAMTASFVGLALFSLCFLLALLLHRSLSHLPGGRFRAVAPG